MKVFLVEIVQLHLRTKQQMLEEECLDCGQNSARSTLVLENAVFDILVEKEALSPRVVNVAFPVFEQKSLNTVGFFSADGRFLRVLRQLLPER